MKGKKGVSPLIATVLVIGFTIVLAALVMQWGGGLFKGVQEDTAETSDFKIACSTKLVNLDVMAEKVVDNVTVTLDNKNDFSDLSGIQIRLYNEAGKALGAPVKDEGDIPPFEVGEVTLPFAAGAKEVGVFPIVKVKGKDKVCENEFKSGIDGA